MNLATKVGLGVAALAVAGIVALRFGGSTAAKSGLDQALANLPPGWAATHGAVSYNALSGEAQVDNLVVTRDGAPFLSAGSVFATGIEGASATEPPKRIAKIVVKDLTGNTYRHVGQIEVEGLEVANLRSLFDPAAYPNGKPASSDKMKILTSIDASDTTVHLDMPPRAAGAKGPNITAVDAHVGHFHNDGICARQFASPPTNGSLQDMAFLADAARAVSEDGATAKDITEDLGGPGSIAIGSTSLTDLRDGKIGTLEEHDLAFTGRDKPNTFGVDRIAAKDVDLNKLLDQLPQLAVPGAKPKLNAGFKVGEFDIDGLAANFENAPLISMTSLEGQSHDNAGGVNDGTLTMRGLKIATSGRAIKPQIRQMLDRFGMADFVIDLDETGTYQPSDGHLKLSKADILFHDLGTLHIALDVAGLQNAGSMATDKAAALAAIVLTSATVQWTDDSLTNRVFKTVAAQSGKSVDDLRSTLALPVASLGVFLPNQPDAPAQVNAFLADPKQLTITLAPPSPVSLLDVAKASAQEKAALLGVTIKGD